MPSEVPSGWRQSTVQEVVDPRRRVTYGIVQPGPRQEHGGIPVIRGQDYSGGEVDDSDLYRVSDEIAAKYRRSTLQGGDILLSIVGYLGLTAMVPDHLTGANLTQTTARIAINSANYHLFFHYQFQGPAFTMEVRRFAKGSAQPGLNLADVERMKVVVPPLPEQKKIAAILSSVDEAIQAKRAVIEQTRRVKEGLLQDLLTRGIGHTRFKQTEIGEIPEGWEVRLLSEIADFTTGRLDSNAAVPGGRYPFFTCAKQTLEIDSYSFDREALLLAGNNAKGEYSVKHYVGKFDAYQRTYVIGARTERVTFSFLRHAMQAQLTRLTRLSTGSATKFLTLKVLNRLPVPIPTLSEQEAITSALDLVDRQYDVGQEALASKQLLKAGLLQDLLTGKVRVSV